MHQNTLLTTPDSKKYLFLQKVSGGLELCANASKHVLNDSRLSIISFFLNLLVVWKYAQMHKTRF
jgi:hypothetical protein